MNFLGKQQNKDYLKLHLIKYGKETKKSVKKRQQERQERELMKLLDNLIKEQAVNSSEIQRQC